MMTTRAGKLGFFKIFVADLDGMIGFYERAFGFALHMCFDDPAFEEALLRQEDHDFLLVLQRWKDAAAHRGPPTVGVIGMIAEDVEAAVRFACAAGAVLKQAPFAIPGTRVAFVTDPEGNEIELVQFV